MHTFLGVSVQKGARAAPFIGKLICGRPAWSWLTYTWLGSRSLPVNCGLFPGLYCVYCVGSKAAPSVAGEEPVFQNSSSPVFISELTASVWFPENPGNSTEMLGFPFLVTIQMFGSLTPIPPF